MSNGVSHEKIAGPMTLIFSGNPGTVIKFLLAPRSGGRNCKVVQYTVKILEYHGSGPKLGFIIAHSADGTTPLNHTSAAATTLTTTAPFQMVFDATAVVNATTALGEFLHPIVQLDGAASGDTVTIEVWETRKPF